MEVKIKRLHKDAVVPKYALEGDAGLDLTCVSRVFDEFGNVHYGTGLAFKIPEGYVGLLFPRSSNAKKDLLLSNSVGIIDSNYIGEVSLKFKPSTVFFDDVYAEGGSIGRIGDSFDRVELSNESNGMQTVVYEVGERVGQLLILPYPKIEFLEVEDLGETNRGEGSYGSTGR